MAKRNLGSIIKGLFKGNQEPLRFANARRDEVLENIITHPDNSFTIDEENKKSRIAKMAQMSYENNNVDQIRNVFSFLVDSLKNVIDRNRNDKDIDELADKLD